ncbi:nuclear transport factor 2 family protein [Massilia sp. H-1]|nr:nuclear transport factor 2 family protein [Massilia sp. H-1]
MSDTERAFAATMKARDHAAFVAFVADDAVFFNGPAPLHGKKRWATSGKSSTTSLAAPFSWEPDQVEVLASGKLAASSGPGLQPRGQADPRFNSIWRREASGKWKIVFDKGEDLCDCKKPAP